MGVAVTDPSITSEWPTTYLVQARIDRSTPCAMAGNSRGVDQVLSSSVTTPAARAAAVMAGTSCTSKVRLPGLSMKSALVAGPISSAMPAPIVGS